MSQFSLGPLERIVRESHEYARTPPNLYNFASDHSDLLRYILRELVLETVACPDEGVWVERNCIVLDGKFVLRGDGDIAIETAADKALEHIEAAFAQYRDGNEIVPLRDRITNNHPVIHIMKEGAANFGHILVEMLPKLVNVRNMGWRDVNVILPAEAQWATRLFQQTAERLELNLTLVPVEAQSAVLVDKLHILSPVSKHNARKSRTLLEFRDLMLRNTQSTKGRGGRLAVWRKPNDKRQLLNDRKVRRLLKKRHFEIIDPADLSLDDELRAFGEASEIVGLSGAGMTSCIFSPPETRVFIIDYGIYDFFFWDLCCLNGNEFHWYFDQPLEMLTIEKLSAPFAINPRRLDAALDCFLS